MQSIQQERHLFVIPACPESAPIHKTIPDAPDLFGIAGMTITVSLKC